ncbi:MAG: 50S ribosomal protein L10 [Parcubacteria group bacterium CG1_02_37_51]|uniref:Large ribosomal subunit protein uL10 n=2 Tax=Candidatus Komeiliibacteriota TaxID=1817908 RepID=A0A2M8DQT0_9BACT|nr:MAG: 50S ribosomal protein L10 [Parcubacteria group bacterium CG1_02_37_51]PIY94041.1 MAG: 50S ribosomal protein L10 [Candidatus Komeilibacteria bacterium CG_4_10_14_0_8_um_filter_37_78]PJC01628.1 MAG: 50S ribosomal protein L10 [Candidatus Komeilibacteria bacterium CG_4_9_14_0_8_um_filter_36_9]
MAKTKDQKQQEVKALQEKLADAKSIVFTSFQGLSVESTEVLRSKFCEAGVVYQAAKKRLFDLAFDEAKIEHDSIYNLEGSIAAAFSIADEVSAAKVAKEFSKTNDSLSIKSGFLKVGETWKYLTEAEVMNLANLPTRDELLVRVVGSINAPISGLVNVLAGNIRGLVNVLSAIKDTK